jgi:hypothetical protein
VKRVWRIINHPLGALFRFFDGSLFRFKDERSVPRCPRLTLILAVNPIEWSPRFVGRPVYLTGGGDDGEAFVVVMHTPILARGESRSLPVQIETKPDRSDTGH